MKKLILLFALLAPCLGHADPGDVTVINTISPKNYPNSFQYVTRSTYVFVSTAPFSKNLGPTDLTVQHALETLDQLTATGGGGASAIAIKQNGVSVSSPTSVINILSPLIATFAGGTTAQVTIDTTTASGILSRTSNYVSSLTVTSGLLLNGTNNTFAAVPIIGINFSSVVSQSDLSVYMTQSSSTLNDLKLSSATVTYRNILTPTVSSVSVTQALTLGGTNALPIIGINASSVAVLSGGLIPNSEIDGSSITKQGTFSASTNITFTPTGTGIAISASGGGTGTPGGSPPQLQINGGGVFIGTQTLTMNTTSNLLTIGATTQFTSVSTTSWTNVSTMTFGNGSALVMSTSTNLQTPSGQILTNGSSVTVQGVITAGTNITLTPTPGVLTISASGGGGGSSIYSATSTASFPFGLTASTETISTMTVTGQIIMPNTAVGIPSLVRSGATTTGVGLESNFVDLDVSGNVIAQAASNKFMINYLTVMDGTNSISSTNTATILIQSEPASDTLFYNRLNITHQNNASRIRGFGFGLRDNNGEDPYLFISNYDAVTGFAPNDLIHIDVSSSSASSGFVGINVSTPISGLHVNGLGGVTVSSNSLNGSISYLNALPGLSISTNTQVNGSLLVVTASTQPSTILNGLVVFGPIITSSTTPVISSCGSTPNGSVVGNDFSGKITIGGGVVTSCTMTFAATKANAPPCTIASNTAITAPTASTTVTALTLGSGATFNGDIIMYTCGNYQ